MQIFVKSSNKENSYSITVSSTESGLVMTCSCPAGELGQFCKHKAAVVSKHSAILYDNNQIDTFNKISSLLDKTKLPALLMQIKDSEKELEAMKKNIRNMKVQIARLMRDGADQ